MNFKIANILVWDAPTRIFHWLLVLCFAGSYLSAENDQLSGMHVTLGYTMAGLVVFRLLWGLIGTRYARFASFIRGPRAVARYASSMLSSRPEHHLGHNPIGALSIVLMLLITLAIVGTGWFYFNGGTHQIGNVHEAAAAFMLAVVFAHVVGVVFASLTQRENLVRSMLNGRKMGIQQQGIDQPLWPVAVLVLACVLGFWWLQWQSPPRLAADGNNVQSVVDTSKHGRHSKSGKPADGDD